MYGNTGFIMHVPLQYSYGFKRIDAPTALSIYVVAWKS